MVRSLHLKLSHVRNLSWKKYERFALVDTQPRSGNNQLPARIVPDIVLDHHPVRPSTQAGPTCNGSRSFKYASMVFRFGG